jgi:predicted nucleic acid-binding protein
MMTVVADAAPIIFLAKLDRLALIRAVFPGVTMVPDSVSRELLQAAIPPAEAVAIRNFLATCRVLSVPHPAFPSQTLSLADRSVLTLASRQKRALVLTDDALVRRVARSAAIPVAGTLGVLLRAQRARRISSAQAQAALDDLVARHNFHISIALYQEATRQLAAGRGTSSHR